MQHLPSSRPLAALLGLALLAAAGCLSTRSDAERRTAQARHEFMRVVRELQVPAGDATNEVVRGELLTNAVAGYLDLVARYPDQPQWCAQALRSVANIYRAEGRRAEALATYERLAHRYPGEHWEVIQAWKAAGDLMWDSRMRELARGYYQQIVDTYSGPDQPPMFQTIVDIARQRLSAGRDP
jgi:tetratricopeptide (TPR) repeat protein